jgi:hypothetical protein
MWIACSRNRCSGVVAAGVGAGERGVAATGGHALGVAVVSIGVVPGVAAIGSGRP